VLKVLIDLINNIKNIPNINIISGRNPDIILSIKTFAVDLVVLNFKIICLRFLISIRVSLNLSITSQVIFAVVVLVLEVSFLAACKYKVVVKNTISIKEILIKCFPDIIGL
jgi:type IV secretory pathway TrbL component